MELRARTLHDGDAAGPLLVLDEPLSLWGGTDPETGLASVHATELHARVSLT
jgi:predicted aconitase with swiveling domain